MVLRKLWRQQLEPPAAGWTLESSLIGVAEVKPLLLRMVEAPLGRMGFAAPFERKRTTVGNGLMGSRRSWSPNRSNATRFWQVTKL